MADIENSFLNHCITLNTLYLEKAIDIERIFVRNIVYISLALIVVSLLCVKEFKGLGGTAIQSLPSLYLSWFFSILAICSSAVMVFCSAIFKDIMFEGTYRFIKDNDASVLDVARSHITGIIVYISALLAAIFFILSLISCLLFISGNIF